MKPIDLTGLIKGLMVVIGIAVAMGKLSELKRWAAKEAFVQRSPSNRLINLGRKPTNFRN